MKTKLILIALFLCSFTVLFGQKKLVILHTNDTHSRIEPLTASDKRNAHMAGVVNRKAVIDSIRKVENNVLLLDAGDFVQGTPYFNLFGGMVEIGVLNQLGYEVGTIGNHEFDNGMEALAFWIKNLSFPIVNCNYDFTGTPIEGLVKPYVILNKKGVRVGIIGVGVDPEGLIQKDKYEGMKFNPIIESVNRYAEQIRKECDVLICLSHSGIATDREIAAQSENIDLIIGGHSHTFMEAPEMIQNTRGKEVLVYQVGKNAAYLGKVELQLNEKK